MAAYVYFALAGNLVKIGCTRGSFFSACPVTRARALKAEFVGCIPVAEGNELATERRIHANFKDCRDKEEWFFFSRALREFIQTETRGHICGRCAGCTLEEQREADQAIARALGARPRE